MKKLIKKHEMTILKGLLLITVVGSIVITTVETIKSMNEFEEYQLKFEENLNKLAAILAFLDNSDELQEVLTEEDWKEIGELVNDEAEDLPIDILQDLMKILVEKGAY